MPAGAGHTCACLEYLSHKPECSDPSGQDRNPEIAGVGRPRSRVSPGLPAWPCLASAARARCAAAGSDALAAGARRAAPSTVSRIWAPAGATPGITPSASLRAIKMKYI